jgi:hypothetical protein
MQETIIFSSVSTDLPAQAGIVIDEIAHSAHVHAQTTSQVVLPDDPNDAFLCESCQ